MGAFFTNYHIRKGKKQRGAFIRKLSGFISGNMGYSPCEKEKSDGFVTVFFPEKGEWISLFTDLMEPENEAPAQLSGAFCSDVLCITCNDSDFVTLRLVNGRKKTDVRANAGRFNDFGLEPPTDLSGWEGSVSDIEKFRADLAEEHVFAEDFLDTLDETLGLPSEQARLEEHTVDGPDDGRVVTLYFKLNGMKITEPVKLDLLTTQVSPVTFDRQRGANVITVWNKGRASKGLKIMFTGDYAENGEITFYDAYLLCDMNGSGESVPVELKRVRLKNGCFAYSWEDERYGIPAAPDPYLSSQKWHNERFKREIKLGFYAGGNSRRALDVKVWFIPLENPEGACSWCVWHSSGSKAGYIEKYNQLQRELSPDLTDEQRKDPSRGAFALLDPNDFDLD